MKSRARSSAEHRGARNAERGVAKIEIDAGDSPRAGQCGGVCVDIGHEDGTSLH